MDELSVLICSTAPLKTDLVFWQNAAEVKGAFLQEGDTDQLFVSGF